MPHDEDVRYEEAYVGWVHEIIRSLIIRLGSLSGAAGDRSTHVALNKVAESRIKKLREAEREVLFGRLDMASDDTFYVGKILIADDDADLPAVVDWRSGIGECFYQATHAEPAGVGRRRTINVSGRRVSKVSDELLTPGFVAPSSELQVPTPPPGAELPPPLPPEFRAPSDDAELIETPPVALEPAAAESPKALGHGVDGEPSISWFDAGPEPEAEASEPAGADPFADTEFSAPEAAEQLPLIVSEEFELRAGDILLDELERARSGTMGEIVATIQADQDRLIRADPDEPLVIQGGPGTGKTVVALHRAAWVLYQQRERNFGQSVLVVGPNRRFLSYIHGVLPALGEMETTQSTIDDLARSRLGTADVVRTAVRRGDDLETERLKGDSRMAEVIARAVWQACAPESLEVGFGRFTLRLDQQQVEELIERSWFSSLPYAEARREFVEQVVEALEGELVRRGGSLSASADALEQLKRQARQSLRDDGTIRRVFPQVTPRAIVRRLMLDAEFRDLVADDLTESERALLGRGAVGSNRYSWTAADLPLLDEAAFVIDGQPDRSSHVIVDEAQDLSPMQWRVIRRRCVGRSATIAGDLAQATSAWSPSSWDEVAKRAGFGETVDVSELRLGYRVPMPIMEYAGRLLPIAAPSVELPQSFRAGTDPVMHSVSKTGVVDAAVSAAEGWNEQPGSMALVCPPSMERALQKAVDDSALGEGRVEVIVDHMAKGLEFDRVIMVEPHLIARGDVPGLRRLYICLTRATQELAVVHSEAPPEPLGMPTDWRLRDTAVRLRERVRESRLKGATGTREWRSQVAKEYPQAYRRWTPAEEAQLREEIGTGKSIEEIAELHHRRPGAIRSRVQKLGL